MSRFRAAIGVPILSLASIYAFYRLLNASYQLPPVIPPGSRTDHSLAATIPPDTDTIRPAPPKTYAVIGGGGFLGSYVVYRLLRTRNVRKVYVFDLGLGSSAWLYERREEVEFVKVDMTEKEEVEKAIGESGAEVVIVTAALIKHQEYLEKDYAKSYRVNVEGTENILRACAATPSVKHLVNTSSVAACLGWDRFNTGRFWDLNEHDAPRAEKHFSHYGRTKALAEQLVESYDGRGVRTVTLRAGGIYGYGDLFMFSGLKNATGLTTFMYNWDYVENMAQALITAADALETNPDNVGGRTFFANDGLVTNQEIFVKGFKKLRPEMVPASHFLVPDFVIFATAVIGDILYRLGSRGPEDLTVAAYYTTVRSFTFSNEAALKALGDWRRWTPDESLGRSVHLAELHRSTMQMHGVRLKPAF
ncbi:hypothetical protein BJ742DRAFT_843490 [Cladochytrium replicatum]|nr:hypothetical protein BJ742DRAFT_843490 [Cladochytrium replicatum]